jgi:hypothetical protein
LTSLSYLTSSVRPKTSFARIDKVGSKATELA